MKKSILLMAVLALAAFGMVFTGCDNGSSSPEYRVSFDLNWYGEAAEGMGEVEAPKPVWFKAIGQSITLPQVLDSEGNIYFTENGYYVSNWYKDMNLTQSAGSAFTGEAKFTPEGSCTLYADWTRRAVTLRLDLNYPAGVSVPLEELKKCAKTRPFAGTAISLPAATPAPIPEGEFKDTEFAGWFDSPVNGEGNQVVSGETKVPVDGVTYYAQWKYPVKVTYLLPDGTEYKVVEQKAYDAVEMPANPTLDPCFAGWFDQDGKMLTADVIIKKDAVYTAKAGYTLVINKTSGAADGKAGVDAGSTALTIITEPDDHASGRYVEGYYADEACTTKVAYNDGKLIPNAGRLTDADGKWTGDSTTVLYANWKEFSKIGSTLVFYIDKKSEDVRAAANYKFYDASNNLLTATEAADGITFSDTPVKYAFYGEGRDRYYVAGTLETAPWSFNYIDDGDITSSNYKTERLDDKLKLYNGDVTHTKGSDSYKGAGTFLGVGRLDTETMLHWDSENEVLLVDKYGPYAGGEYKHEKKTKPNVWIKLLEYRTSTGIDDWFIPSAEELWRLAQNTSVKEKICWMSGYAWSSSVYGDNDYNSWLVNADGSLANTKRYINYAVVPVRAF